MGNHMVETSVILTCWSSPSCSPRLRLVETGGIFKQGPRPDGVSKETSTVHVSALNPQGNGDADYHCGRWEDQEV